MKTLNAVATELTSGTTTSRAITEAVLGRIASPSGEGERAFVRVFREEALAEAEASDGLRRAGIVHSPLAGIPISIKDLCDVRGYTTLAGSASRRNDPPAQNDAMVLSRLRQAGAVIVGTTNMVEFAFGGAGLNPHFGDCRNPWDRATGRIPGGSSSGAAVSVSDEMAYAALGTDTMGSVRIPAGFCGLVGFKPTAARIPTDGIFPLSTSLDSVGSIANSVACCALMDAILAGEPPHPVECIALADMRFAIPRTLVLDNLDRDVGEAFQRALSNLSAAGARISEIPFSEIAEIADINRDRGISMIESYALHRTWLETRGERYDPRISSRMMRAATIGAATYYDVLKQRASLIRRGRAVMQGFDAVIMPTLPVVAPAIKQFKGSEEALRDAFPLATRNTCVANYLDGCAITIPCHVHGSAPVGITLMGMAMADHKLLAIARGVERCVQPHRA